MNIKNYLSYFLAIIALGILFFLIDFNDFNILMSVSIKSFLISIIFAFCSYFLSGIQYYYVRKQFGVSLKLVDIILLPIVGNLWSFIFPFQGNLMFTTLFFKKKYNMKISESFSISFYLYIITVIFTGLFIGFFVLLNDLFYSWLTFFALIFIFNPFFIYLFYFLFKNTGKSNIKIIDKVKLFLTSVIENTKDLWTNSKFTFIMFSLNIIKLALNILWFYWISISLGFNLAIISVALISLIMSISTVIKFTPDNLGVVQVITAALMSFIGSDPKQAALISLFASGNSIILILTIGIYGNYYYFKNINLLDIIKG